MSARIPRMLLVAASLALTSLTRLASSTAAAVTPFGLPGTHVESPDDVGYTIYSGKVPSFDGLPLGVDVTLPDGYAAPGPLVVIVHGWGSQRTTWEATTVRKPDDPMGDDWNNVAFAAKGYAVVNYTTRGWYDSCGPQSAAIPGDPSSLPPACLATRYWVHIADRRWDVRDAQHLIASLVEGGFVSPDEIAVTGGSNGGGITWQLAMLADRVENLDGSYSPWTTPSGTPLHLAAAIPQFTWGSLVDALLPNGRTSDTDDGAVNRGHEPVGVLLESFLAGYFVEGEPSGNAFYAPPRLDPTADLDSWVLRFVAGSPFRDDAALDPVMHEALGEFDRRSALYQTPSAPVPVFEVEGFTDGVFPASHALTMRNHLKAWRADYPVKTFLGDLGHTPAANTLETWTAAHALAHAFLAYHLKHVGSEPSDDVTAVTASCDLAPAATFTATSWRALSAGPTRTYSSSAPQLTTSASVGTVSVVGDPVVQGQALSAVCTRVRAVADPGIARWDFAIDAPFVLLGTPRLAVEVAVAGVDAELNARVWDVSPDGATEALVSHGTYRYTSSLPSVAPRTVSFETSANAWHFQPGHTLRIEITGNDAPYHQADNLPAVLAVSSMRLRLPTARRPKRMEAL